ncbi:hypothetical protein M3J09_012168 [Ascochyta lentis]
MEFELWLRNHKQPIDINQLKASEHRTLMRRSKLAHKKWGVLHSSLVQDQIPPLQAADTQPASYSPRTQTHVAAFSSLTEIRDTPTGTIQHKPRSSSVVLSDDQARLNRIAQTLPTVGPQLLNVPEPYPSLFEDTAIVIQYYKPPIPIATIDTEVYKLAEGNQLQRHSDAWTNRI